MARNEAWRSASRQCDIKGTIHDVDDAGGQMLIKSTHRYGIEAHRDCAGAIILCRFSAIMQLRKTRKNMKSRVVHRVKEDIQKA